MKMTTRFRSIAPVLMALALAAAATACCSDNARTQDEAIAPVHGKVSDADAFDRFIATRPTPAEFRQRYPDLKLVLPGEMATKELRLDRSRYFAELDADGRIQGGRFK